MSKWISRLLNIDSNDSLSEHGFQTRVLTSVVCIVFCMVTMLSTAYAWFIVDVSSGETTILSANYSLNIVASGSNAVHANEHGTYTYECELTDEDKHYFTLTPTGTTTNGYCKVKISGLKNGQEYEQTYYIDPIPNDGNVCVIAAEESVIEFTPTWGTYKTASKFSLKRKNVFTINHSRTPYVKYKVVAGVTLEDLADYYGVSVEDICIYNGIEELEVGDVILIPGIEDDSIEPYKPEQPEKASPSNPKEKKEDADGEGDEKEDSDDSAELESATPSNPKEKDKQDGSEGKQSEVKAVKSPKVATGSNTSSAK